MKKGVAFHTPKKKGDREMRRYLNFQLEYLAKRGVDLEMYRIFTSSIIKQDAGSRECKLNPFSCFLSCAVLFIVSKHT